MNDIHAQHVLQNCLVQIRCLETEWIFFGFGFELKVKLDVVMKCDQRNVLLWTK